MGLVLQVGTLLVAAVVEAARIDPGPEAETDGAGDELPAPPEQDTEGELELGELDHTARSREFAEHLGKAKVAQRANRHDEAIREFTAALNLVPGDPEALLGRAFSRHAKSVRGECPRRAIEDLLMLRTYDPRGEWAKERGRAVSWMADCGDSHFVQRLALAQELAALDVGSEGRPDDIRVTVAELQFQRVARVSAAERAPLQEAALDELARYREECRALGHPPAVQALKLEARILVRDDPDRALAVYRDLLRLHPEAAEFAAAEVRKLEFEARVREMQKTQGGRPTEAARAAYLVGQAAMQRGELDEAEREFTRAIDDAPWFREPYVARGDVLARKGRFLLAVEDLKRAVVMDRSDYRAHLLLGHLYKKEFAGAEDDAAREHLEVALLLRPDLIHLHMLLGELYARGDRGKAREHYRRFLRTASKDDPDISRARQALDELDREVEDDAPPVVGPPQESLRLLDPELQRLITEAFLWGTERQDWARAEKILQRARERHPDEPVVVNQLARVALAAGRNGDARAFWEQSLAMREDQMEVHELLGVLLERDLSEQAEMHLRRAAELGSTHARFRLAELLWSDAEPLEASRQLDHYLREAGQYDSDWDRAVRLRQRIDGAFLQVWVAASLVLALIVGVPGWRVYRRYRGVSIEQLLARHPKSFPEVARVLSLVRHEILKHNTAFLVDVGRALAYDLPDADARAVILGRRLFGEEVRAGQRPRARSGAGIYGRFLGYCAELEQIARSHGVTLNLQRKDPIFRAMREAFDGLAMRSTELHNAGGLAPERRLDLARALGRAGLVLGRQAFERMSGLIRSLCVVVVDQTLVRRAHGLVAGESQFAGHALAPLDVEGEGAPIRIFRTDLEDILVNVIRNSLRSSVLHGLPPATLGVGLVTEIDDITGLSTLAIRIKDRSPEPLSNEMLRGRYVERGMGITVDLLSKYDGSIAVESEPGWNKAVVIRFFVLEESVTAGEAGAI